MFIYSSWNCWHSQVVGPALMLCQGGQTGLEDTLCYVKSYHEATTIIWLITSCWVARRLEISINFCPWS